MTNTAKECRNFLGISTSGHYNNHECEIKLSNVTLYSSGIWICDIESYLLSGARSTRSLARASLTLSVTKKETTTTTIITQNGTIRGPDGRYCQSYCGERCEECHSQCERHYNTGIKPPNRNCVFDVADSPIISLHVSNQSDKWEPRTKYVGMVFWGHEGKSDKNNYYIGNVHIRPGYIFIMKSETIMNQPTLSGMIICRGKSLLESWGISFLPD